MTTIIATSNKILSDGKVTFGDRVDSLEFKKVRKIDGYLVGGAGRLTSVLSFFTWFEQNLQCQAAQEAVPGLMIQSSPEKDDEEFIAVVVHPDGKIYVHEGNDPTRARLIEAEYYAVGSGSDYALAALDAGATPEVALDVAKYRDCFSGGLTFVEELDEIVEITEEDLQSFSKEQLINLLLTGSPDPEPPAQEGEIVAAEDAAVFLPSDKATPEPYDVAE